MAQTAAAAPGTGLDPENYSAPALWPAGQLSRLRCQSLNYAQRQVPEVPGARPDICEEYDLVIVGAGISGLSAAHFYPQGFGRRTQRILILDNQDDIGGHAKRNQFEHAGKTYLGLAAPWPSPRPTL